MGDGILKRIFAVFVTVACVLGMIPMGASVASAATSSSSSSSSKQSSDISADAANLYDAASGAAGYVDTVMGTGNSNKLGADIQRFGNFAAGLGYPDAKGIKKYAGQEWPIHLAINSAENTVIYSYSEDDKDVASKRIKEYGRFGYLLSVLGYDGTGNVGISDRARWIEGSLLHLVYYGAAASHNVMKWSIGMLKFLNPFALILEPNEVSSNDPTGFLSGNPGGKNQSNWLNKGAATGDSYKKEDPSGSGVNGGEVGTSDGAGASNTVFVAGAGEEGGALGKVVEGYRQIYRVMKNLSLTVLLPLGLAIAIFMYVMAKASFAKPISDNTAFKFSI